MILTKLFPYLHLHINIYPITCLSCKSGNAVYVDSERSDSFLDRRGEALRGGKVKPEKEKCFSSDFCQEAIPTRMASADDFPLPSSTTACPINISMKQAKIFEVKIFIDLVVEEKVSRL